MATTPQDWGLPLNAGADERACWYRQEAFLDAFRKCGKIGRAAQAVGITRWAVERWQRTDVYGFKKRLEGAHADYVENLEVDMDDFIATSKHNTQIIRIFRLRAEAPEKYREEVKVLGVEPPIRMLEKLKELGKKELEALEAPAVEGEYREVEGPERGLQGTRPPLTPGPVPVKEVQLLTPEQAVRLYMRCALGQRANTVLAPWNRAAQAHWGTIPWTFAYC